jgi:3-oxoacyl-[acyl-carrier-protein] synthase I
MKRVVVTGLGVVCAIGNDTSEVLGALREGRSGIDCIRDMRELGFKCWVGGSVKGLEAGRIEKRARQTMSRVALYTACAALEGLEDAKLPRQCLPEMKAGIVVGTSFGGIGEWAQAQMLLEKYRNPSRLGATGLVKGMHSTASGNLAAWLGMQRRAYSLCSSFCAGVDNIGHAAELLARGVLDVCIAGASEESTWRQVGGFFDNWHGMPTSWNDQPTKACRPYDRDRQGFVLSEGAGIVILETLEHAERRGVAPYAEVVGYGSANDGYDMFQPSGDGLRASLQQALTMAKERGVERIDYINSHGTGTRLHDPLEVRVISELFGPRSPHVSSTKPVAGHALGATGAIEAVFTLLMMRHGFIVPTANLDHIADDCQGVRHVQELMEQPVEAAMTLNAGLGGTNACLVFRKL